MTDSKNFDVIIIGGSYAGLSAAMALGRSLRKVLVIDSGQPCNSNTPHSQNFLTQDGNTPNEIATLAKKQVENYETVHFHTGVATLGIKTAQGFEITTATKDTFTARKLIFATGVKDILPDIDGFAACWGISVIHCPYCHGYEYRNQNTGIIANGELAFHLASLVRNLTDKLTIFTTGKADFDIGQIEKLGKNSIRILETEITAIEHDNGHLKHVVFKDGTTMPLEVTYAAIPFEQHCAIPASLGCELTEHGYLTVDPFQKTTVEGVFACGDNTSRMRSIANAVYGGNLTGAVVNAELAHEQF